MIVTFHVVVYFASQFWNNYISALFRNNNVISNNNHIPDDPNISDISRRTETNSDNEPVDENTFNQNFTNKNETFNIDSDICQHITEDEDNLQSSAESIFGDESENSIMPDVESTFVCEVSEEKGMTFIPPVYTQRYMVIESILKKPCWVDNIKKVVDFGCAELKFESKFLKRLFGIEEIVAVDIDEDLLTYNSCAVTTTPTDYLMPRPTPLTVRVFCGSVAHTHQALDNCDAVIAIELIEHLYPGDLEHLPFTVFGYIRPKIAMFTTPNSDFNVLFPNFSGFRHDDHKFEWSRQQFEDWGNNLVLRYPDYSVTFKGIGPGPEGTEHLGCCSQMATFIRVNNSPPCAEDELHVQDGNYTLIRECEFPFYVDNRTREEKLRDEAVNFINRLSMLTRQFDDEKLTEIPLKSIMERIGCRQAQKLKNVLIKDNWQIKINPDGHEVVIIPDSENEDEDLVSDNGEELVGSENNCVVNCDYTFNCDENWDCDEIESQVNENSSINRSSALMCTSEQIDEDIHMSKNGLFAANDSKITEQTTENDILDTSLDEKLCCTPNYIVPSVNIVHKCDSSGKDDVLQKDMDLDYSIYETPYNNGRTFIAKSDCESLNATCECVDYGEPNPSNGCSKALSFMSPSYKEHELNNSDPYSDSTNGCAKTDSFCCARVVSSPLDISTYATPYCSQQHKKYIPKCLSLQQISAHEAESPLRENRCIGEQKEKVSKSMEGFKTQESCDIHETCSNASRVVDSGYPDSYSEHNMDMDLTPEQFDDIETESEGNVSSRSASPPPPVPPVLRMVDDVQNGDVANNNRDGEGNNVIANMEEEALEFEAQIEEVNNELPNLAAVEVVGLNIQQCHDRTNLPGFSQEKYDEFCNSSEVGTSRTNSVCSLEQQKTTNEISENRMLLPTNKESTVSLDTSFNKAVDKSTESCSSIASGCSWGHLNSPDSQSFNSCSSKGMNESNISQGSCNLKEQTSLTTVLNGCSRFSNCSILEPERDVMENHKLDDNSSRSKTPNVDRLQAKDNSDDDLPELDCLSIRSEYESVSSIHSANDYENSSFPGWLLNLVTDDDEEEVASISSVMTVWDVDSVPDLDRLNYDVQIDIKGGGDPQRYQWN